MLANSERIKISSKILKNANVLILKKIQEEQQ